MKRKGLFDIQKTYIESFNGHKTYLLILKNKLIGKEISVQKLWFQPKIKLLNLYLQVIVTSDSNSIDNAKENKFFLNISLLQKIIKFTFVTLRNYL